MSLRKAYCVKCHRKNEKLRIFEVSPEASIAYCPHCMAKLEPKEAIEAYDLLIEKMLKEARVVLYQKTDFAQAYSMFAHIIEIDESNIEARFGRIISLLYLSKLRRSRFQDCELMIKEESANMFHKAANYDKYYGFLDKVNRTVDQYHDNFKKRLSYKTYFYDDECIKLYYQRIKENIGIKQFLLEEAKWLVEKHENESNVNLLNAIQVSLDELNNELTSKVIALDGYTYGLAGFGFNGVAVLGHNTKRKELKVRLFKTSSLGNNDKKTKVIVDDVFPDHLRMYGFDRQVIGWIIINAVLTVASLTCFLLIKTKPFDLVSMICLAFFGSATLTLVILKIISWLSLRKRRTLVSGGEKKAS